MQHELRPALYREKQVGWAAELGGAEPLSISKAGPTVLARLVKSQIWDQLAGSVREGLENGQWPPFPPMPDPSVPPCMSLGPFKLPSWRWSSEGLSLSR